MSSYHTEGFVKTVTKTDDGVKFTIEVAAPYLFESKEKKESDSTTQKMLLVADNESNAKIYAANKEFEMADAEMTTLLIAKSNHMKIRLFVTIKKEASLVVSKLEIP